MAGCTALRGRVGVAHWEAVGDTGYVGYYGVGLRFAFGKPSQRLVPPAASYTP